MIDHATGEKIEGIGARREAVRLKALMDRHIDPREEKTERQAAHEARKLESRRPDKRRTGLRKLRALKLREPCACSRTTDSCI